MTTATERLNKAAARRFQLKAALDESGIGQDVVEVLCAQFGEIAAFFAAAQARACSQAVHNRLVNVPCGILRHADCTARAAIRTGAVGAIAEHLKWDYASCLFFCADLLEDANYHDEAKRLRTWATRGTTDADTESEVAS